MFYGPKGNQYSENDLIAFETGDASEPVVYVSRDQQCVFVVTMSGSKMAHVHLAGPAEVAELAVRYDLPQIRSERPAA